MSKRGHSRFFTFGFGFPFPGLFWTMRPWRFSFGWGSPSRAEYREMLEDYKRELEDYRRDLDEELKRVEEELEHLAKEEHEA